jgi:CRP-like cAMP-binding protein
MQWITTVQTGETLGETAMLKGSRRNYNAIAGSPVEVFALTKEGFEKLVERYVSGSHNEQDYKYLRLIFGTQFLTL